MKGDVLFCFVCTQEKNSLGGKKWLHSLNLTLLCKKSKIPCRWRPQDLEKILSQAHRYVVIMKPMKFPVLELMSVQHFHMHCSAMLTKFFFFLHLVMSAWKTKCLRKQHLVWLVCVVRVEGLRDRNLMNLVEKSILFTAWQASFDPCTPFFSGMLYMYFSFTENCCSHKLGQDYR